MTQFLFLLFMCMVAGASICACQATKKRDRRTGADAGWCVAFSLMAIFLVGAMVVEQIQGF